MNLKTFLSTMLLGTGLSWFGWLMILFFINPQEIGVLTLLLFYLTLGVAILGTATLLGFLVRNVFVKKEVAFENVITSFRQGFWLSLVVTISLYLQSQGFLKWWNSIFLILGLGLIEFFCLNYQAQNK